LEFVRAPDVVTVTRGAIRNDLAAIVFAYLAGLERLDHPMLACHAADPLVSLDAHVSAVLDGDCGKRLAFSGGADSEPCRRTPCHVAVGARDRSGRIGDHDRLTGVGTLPDPQVEWQFSEQ